MSCGLCTKGTSLALRVLAEERIGSGRRAVSGSGDPEPEGGAAHPSRADFPAHLWLLPASRPAYCGAEAPSPGPAKPVGAEAARRGLCWKKGRRPPSPAPGSAPVSLSCPGARVLRGTSDCDALENSAKRCSQVRLPFDPRPPPEAP